MIRTLSALLLGLAVCALALNVQAADEKKEGKAVKLTGTITCAKCDLGVQKTCATVVDVKDGANKGVYYFDKASNKKYHKQICTTPMKGTVTGTVGKEGDKMTVTVKDVTFSK